MELNGLLPVLRRWAWVIALATALAALIGWRYSATADEGYESSAVILVGPLNTDSDTMRASSALAQTYAELATSESLLERVGEEVDVPVAELEDGVRATANGTTRFLTVTARADEAATARAVADAVTVDLVRQSREGAVRPEGQLRLIDPATAPERPVTPRGDLVVPLAAMAGLLGSAAVVLLYEFVSDAAETTARVRDATGIPTLAAAARRRRLARRRGPDPLRVLGTQVELAHPEMRCVVVCGATERDGSAGLALALAQVWGERRPGVTVLDATGEVLRPWGEDAGPDPQVAARVTEDVARSLVDGLTAAGELVVVATAPPLTSAAALVWAHVADVTVLGVRRFATRLADARDAADNLRAAGAHVPFVLLHDGHVLAESDPHPARRRAPGPDGPSPSGSGRTEVASVPAPVTGAPQPASGGATAGGDGGAVAAASTKATAARGGSARRTGTGGSGRSTAGAGQAKGGAGQAKGGAGPRQGASKAGTRKGRSRTQPARRDGDGDADVAEVAAG